MNCNLDLVKITLPLHIEGEGGWNADDKRWSNSTLYEASQNCEVFDLPLCAICLNQKPWSLSNVRWLLYHIKRVQDANLDYPIILDPDGTIIDGWHRVVKAILEDRLYIKAKRLTVMPEPD